jgi:hypothetical protein
MRRSTTPPATTIVAAIKEYSVNTNQKSAGERIRLMILAGLLRPENTIESLLSASMIADSPIIANEKHATPPAINLTRRFFESETMLPNVAVSRDRASAGSSDGTRG